MTAESIVEQSSLRHCIDIDGEQCGSWPRFQRHCRPDVYELTELQSTQPAPGLTTVSMTR